MIIRGCGDWWAGEKLVQGNQKGQRKHFQLLHSHFRLAVCLLSRHSGCYKGFWVPLRPCLCSRPHTSHQLL